MIATRRDAAVALAAAAFVLSAVLIPLAQSPDDSFPLSSYPMFSFQRGSAADVATAVLVRSDGSVRRLSPEMIARTDEVVFAWAAVRRAVREGRASRLCADIAERLTGRPAAQGGAVEIRTERHDALRYFRTSPPPPPLAVRVSARCAV